jgi:sec-independent protein translocase protein TatA
VGGLGFGELLLIVLVLLFFFGAKRIPEIAKGIGGGIRSFKSEVKGEPRLPEADSHTHQPQHHLPPEDPGAPRA